MLINNLCPPALLYVGFALTQITIDIFRQTYNTAIMKTVVAIVFTSLLNMMCMSGMSIISWFIVFIPFISMTIVTAVLLYVFGLSPVTGKLEKGFDLPKPEEDKIANIMPIQNEDTVKHDDHVGNVVKSDENDMKKKMDKMQVDKEIDDVLSTMEKQNKDGKSNDTLEIEETLSLKAIMVPKHKL